MPDEDDLLTGIVESPKPRRIRPTTPHLDVLSDFAKENNLTVGSTTGGRHNANSLHPSGNAFDAKGSGGYDDATVKRLSARAAERGLLLRDERRRPRGQKVWGGPHLHFEYEGEPQDDLLSGVVKDDVASGTVQPKKPTVTPSITDALDKLARDVTNRTAKIKPMRLRSGMGDVQQASRTINPTVAEIRREEEQPIGFNPQGGQPSRVTQTSDELRVMKGEQPSNRQAYSRQQDAQVRLSRMRDESHRERQSREAKDADWRVKNQPEIDRQTKLYREDIQKAKRLAGNEADKWIAEFGTMAAGQLAELAPGDTAKIHSEAALRAAEEEGADRSQLSKGLQNIGAGFIGTAPELAAMAAGLPPVAAFAGGSAIRSKSSDPMEVAKAAEHGGLTALAFETPGIGEGVKKAVTKALGVGGTSAGLELAQGSSPQEALQAGGVNALMAGTSAMKVKPKGATRAETVSGNKEVISEAGRQREGGEDISRQDIRGEGKGGQQVESSKVPPRGYEQAASHDSEPQKVKPKSPQVSATASPEAVKPEVEQSASMPERVAYLERKLTDMGAEGATLENTPPERLAAISDVRADLEKLRSPQVETPQQNLPESPSKGESIDAVVKPTEAQESTQIESSGGAGRDAPQGERLPASTTSARKEQMRANREELDLPELPAAERKSWQKTLDEAKEKGTQNAGILADEVLAKPRSLNDVETGQLVLRAQEIKNEISKVRQSMVGDPDLASQEAKIAQSQALQREFNRLSEAMRASGSEKGRTLAAQKLTINQDYDLTSMVQRATEARGRDLTPKEHSKVAEQARHIEELTAKLAEAEDKAKASVVQKEIEKVQRKRQRSETKATLDKEAETIRQNIVAEITRLKEQQSSGKFLSQGGLGSLDPEGVISRELVKYFRNRAKANIGLKAEALVGEVHALVSDLGVDKRTIRDLLSGYSIAPKSTRSELQKRLDAVRAELQGLSKTEDIETGIRSPHREGPTKGEARQSGIPTQGPRRSDVREIPAEGPRLSESTERKAGPRITDAPTQGPRKSEARQSGVPLEGPKRSDINKVPVQGPKLSEASRSGQPLEGPHKSEAMKLKAEGPVRPVEGVPKQVFTRDATRRKALLAEESEITRRIADKDYSEKERREPPKYTPETYAIQKRLSEVKQQYESDKYRATRGVTGKIADTAAGFGNIPKTALSMGDVSALLRQGGVGFIQHPILSTKAAGSMLKSFREHGFVNVMSAIKAHPEYETLKRAGVEFTGIDKDNPKLSTHEEGYLGSSAIDTLAKGKYNIPGKAVKLVKDVSERTFVSFLDAQRMNIGAHQIEALRGMGLTPTELQAALKSQAKYINIITGRGNLGNKGNQAAPLLNMAMFSPRLLASRVQLLNKMVNPGSWARLPKGARKLQMIDNAKFMVGTLSVLGLAKAAGADVNLDPDDADFLKIKVGDTRYDTLTGLQQPLRFFLRMLDATTGIGFDADKKRIVRHSGDNYSGDTKSDIFLDFARSKAAPVAGYGWDYLEGKNRLSGKKFEAGADALKTVLPLPYQDFSEAIKKDGALRGTIETLPALLGVGVQTYEGAKDKPKTQAEKLARRLVIRKMPDTAKDQDEIDKSRKLGDLRSRSRKGEDVSSDLQKLLDSGEITKKKGDLILNANANKMLDDLHGAGLMDTLAVYDVASPKERQDIFPLLMRKRHLLNNMEARDKEATETRMRKSGIPITGKIPPMVMPVKKHLKVPPRQVVQSAP